MSNCVLNLNISGVEIVVGVDATNDVYVNMTNDAGASMTLLEADLLIAAIRVAQECSRDAGNAS